MGNCTLYVDRNDVKIEGRDIEYLRKSIEGLQQKYNNSNTFVTDFGLQLTLLFFLYTNTQQFEDLLHSKFVHDWIGTPFSDVIHYHPEFEQFPLHSDDHYRAFEHYHEHKHQSVEFVKSFLPALLPMLLRQYAQKFAKNVYYYFTLKAEPYPEPKTFVIKVSGMMKASMDRLLHILTDKNLRREWDPNVN